MKIITTNFSNGKKVYETDKIEIVNGGFYDGGKTIHFTTYRNSVETLYFSKYKKILVLEDKKESE